MNGFTLIECLWALAIMAIVALMGLPLSQRWLEDNQAQMDLNQLQGALRVARFTAVGRGRQVTLCASSDYQHCNGQWSAGYIVFIDENANAIHDDGEAIIRIVKKKRLPLTYHGFPRDSAVAFSVHGFSAYYNGHFEYQQSSGKLSRLVINQIGQTRIESNTKLQE